MASSASTGVRRMCPSGATMRANDGIGAGLRPVSSIARTIWAVSAMAIPAAATSANVARQPTCNARRGSMAPASAAPAGTPVCLIENVNAMRDGGAVRASTCDDAGVIGP